MNNAFETTKRKSMTPQRRAKIFMENNGKCHRCERKLRAGDKWSVEHIRSLSQGGKDEDKNCGISCSWCKPEKDAEDHAQAAKTRHQATKHIIGRSAPRKGKPLPGTKASGVRKRFNGNVENW